MIREETMNRIRKFTSDREWEPYHTPENLAKSISIEAGELLECFQWGAESFDAENVKDELADVLVYCLQMAEALELDVDDIIMRKMEKNEKKSPVEKAKGNSVKYDKL